VKVILLRKDPSASVNCEVQLPIMVSAVVGSVGVSVVSLSEDVQAVRLIIVNNNNKFFIVKLALIKVVLWC
tara:strand:+ start:103 stop:315 length:213 start_codon:yes stop_codon:yes gene_type:complete